MLNFKDRCADDGYKYKGYSEPTAFNNLLVTGLLRSRPRRTFVRAECCLVMLDILLDGCGSKWSAMEDSASPKPKLPVVLLCLKWNSNRQASITRACQSEGHHDPKRTDFRTRPSNGS